MGCYRLSIEGATHSEKRYDTLPDAIAAAKAYKSAATIAICDCIGLVASVGFNGTVVQYGDTCQSMEVCDSREAQ